MVSSFHMTSLQAVPLPNDPVDAPDKPYFHLHLTHLGIISESDHLPFLTRGKSSPRFRSAAPVVSFLLGYFPTFLSCLHWSLSPSEMM